MAATKIVINKINNLSENERIFLICDKYLWNATYLNVLYRQNGIENSNFCPVCDQDQLSSFSLKASDFINTIVLKNGNLD